MTKTIVALTSVNEDNLQDVSTYMATTGPLLESAKAKIIASFQLDKLIVGTNKPATLTIVEYPDQAAIDSVFESAEYGLLKEIRSRAFSYYQIISLADNEQAAAVERALAQA